jgi:hypothetical protein
MSCSATGGLLREPTDLQRWKPGGTSSHAASLRTLPPGKTPKVEALLKSQTQALADSGLMQESWIPAEKN